MYNYQHEIACPENKGIQNYLWYDYFHDSKINDIVFDRHKKQVIIILECNRDMDEKWKKIKGDFQECKRYINQHIEEFIYILTFKGAEYFNEEKFISLDCYLNGRFKDTAVLKKFKKISSKSLYHFRIQIIGGYIDIVFSDFLIRKKEGRIKYYISEINDYKRNLTSQDREIALKGDDFGRFLAMQRLNSINDSSLLEIARQNLKIEVSCEDSCLYSTYLLGKYGDLSDISNIFNLYVNIEKYMESNYIGGGNILLIKRNILDAIELIQYKNKICEANEVS